MTPESMGLRADQFERFQAARATGASSLEATRIATAPAPAPMALSAATSTSTAARPPSPLGRGRAAHDAKIDLMLAGLRRGFTDEQIAAWKRDQLVEARRRRSSGETMTETQVLLLREATAALPPAAVEIPADVLELAAQGRAMMAAASHTDGDAWVQRAMQAQARRDASMSTTTRPARPAPSGSAMLVGHPSARRISR